MTNAALFRPVAALASGASVTATLKGIGAVAKTWMTRNRTRHQLRQASPEILNDIGVSQAQATSEAGKAFWTA